MKGEKRMKRLIQSVSIFVVFVLTVVCMTAAANASYPEPLRQSGAWTDSELPPDFFDDDCDGGASCPGRLFVDMPAVGRWSHVPIDWALTRHITVGTGKTTFSPRQGCTRAQAVTFLWRAAGSPAPSGTDCPFLDVPEDAYYRTAVIWASENGITTGTSATAFSPRETCRRAQIVVFLWRAKGSPAAASSNLRFADVPATAYYRDAVAWAVEHRITSGTSADAFSPNLTCTREQIVTFLYRSSRS